MIMKQYEWIYFHGCTGCKAKISMNEFPLIHQYRKDKVQVDWETIL